MSTEFPSFGRWVSLERAENIAARAMPGTFRVLHRMLPNNTWAQCDTSKKQILLPNQPIPLFVVLHELAHAWAPRAFHGKAFLEAYQERVWTHWQNAKMSRAFEAACREVLR